MRRRPCPAARQIRAELHADKMQHWYDATHSHRALAALQAARLDAIRRTKKGTGGEPRGKANPSLHARGGEFLFPKTEKDLYERERRAT